MGLPDVRRAPGPATGRRRWMLAAAVAVLVLSNVMSNRVLSSWAYVPWNVSVAVVLLVLARAGGVGFGAVGLGVRRWHRPVAVGLGLAGATALLFAVAMVLPATREAFIDRRVQEWGVGGMLYNTLVRIPLGTVLLEEVAFRGVLPALMGAAPAVRWRWGPVLCASTLFGLWHILPSLGMNTGNAAVAGALGGSQAVTTVLAVLSMIAAGVALCALVRLGRGIKTTILLHWATNSLGFLVAWLIVH